MDRPPLDSAPDTDIARLPSQRELPQRIGRYQVVGRLASGGMGEVLVGRVGGPGGFANLVVVKRLLPQHARDAEYRAMFVDEANIMASLRHRGIVRVLELGEDDGELFLAMEYIEGGSLAQFLRQARAPIDPASVADAVMQAAAALHAVHEARGPDGAPLGIVHRDVSPHNFVLDVDGTARLIDFGVAKWVGQRHARTRTGEIKGKLAYIAPEAVSGLDPVDRRADVFSLGLVLVEMLTGTRVYARSSDAAVIMALLDEPTPSLTELGHPELEPQFGNIVRRSLARSAEDRFASCEELREALAQVAPALGPSCLAARAEAVFGPMCRARLARFSAVRAASPELTDVGTASVRRAEPADLPPAPAPAVAEPQEAITVVAKPSAPSIPEIAAPAAISGAERRPGPRRVAIAAAFVVALAATSIALVIQTGRAGSRQTIDGSATVVATEVTPSTQGTSQASTTRAPLADVASSDPTSRVAEPVPPEEGTGSPALLPMSIVTRPTGALLEVDGVPRGVAPATVEVAIGEHVITARLRGYVTRTVTRQVDDEPAVVTIPLSRASRAVRSEPVDLERFRLE